MDGNIVLQGAIETELAEIGIDKVLKYALTSLPAAPFYLPKGKALREQIDIPITLPSWLSEDELKCYVTQYEKTGFTGSLNYYRNFDLYVAFNLVFIGKLSKCVCLNHFLFLFCRGWELTASWTGSKVEVPTKFIVGDLDLTYNTPGFRESMNFDVMKKHVPLLEDVVVMKGVGHFLQEEKPNEINQHIHDFFHKF